MGPRNSRQTRPPELGPLAALSEEEIVAREAENGLRQFDRAIELVESGLLGPFRLRPSTIIELNRLAIEGLEPMAGSYRQGSIDITNSLHVPPPWEDVPELVEDMCDYVNEHLDPVDGLHVSAFVMWRLNWIHPFTNGNGRTSRIVAYVVLCVALGYQLPGLRTVPDLIVADKGPYYHALDDADAAWRTGRLDIATMEQLLARHLTTQLES